MKLIEKLPFVIVFTFLSLAVCEAEIKTNHIGEEEPIFIELLNNLKNTTQLLNAEITDTLNVSSIDWGKVTTYEGSVSVSINGEKEKTYRISFDSDKNVNAFFPTDLSINAGIGYDTFKDIQLRKEFQEKVENFSRIISLEIFEGPFIQYVDDSYYLVSYCSISKNEIEKNHYLDPYISFLLNKDGEIYAFFRGA